MLNNNLNMLNKYWNHVEFKNSNNLKVSKSSGVYLITRLGTRFLQIPLGLEILYVGKSKNLRNRFSKYTGGFIHNLDLADIIRSEDKLEFWYIEVDEKELDIYETLFIKEAKKINPKIANKITMKNKIGELYV